MNLLNTLAGLLALQTSHRRVRPRHSFQSTQLESRALLSAVGSAQAGAKAVTRIVNGTNTSLYPSVGQVGDSTNGYGCSGTLIAPQYVLTAAHCAEGVSGTGGLFLVGGQEYRTTKIFVHPGYNTDKLGQDGANDIAIFKLDRAVSNVTPTPISRTTPAVRQLLTLVGFGGGGTGTTGHNGDYGIKRVGTTPIDRVTAQTIFWSFDNNSESNTAPGDSGGPAFVTVGGVQYLAGVTSGGTQDNAGIGDQSFDTRVDAYAAWIDSIVGTPVVPTTVSITASDSNAAETKPGEAVNSGSFQVTRTGPTTAPLTVKLTISGSALNGTDYNTIPTTVTIPAGAASASINLIVRDDTLTEGTETAILTLAAGAGYNIDATKTSATVSIADNEVVIANNNNFANRVKITGTAASLTGRNVGATQEVGEPVVAGIGGGKTVWWTWTAPATGSVTISTAGSDFDTALGVYRGTAVNALKLVAENDDENADGDVFTSKVTFNATKGLTYQIAVDGYRGEAGAIKLSLNQVARSRLTVRQAKKEAGLFDF